MNPWVEIAKTYGVTAAVLGAVLLFFARQVWPWIATRFDKSEARTEEAHKLLEQSHANNRQMAKEFAAVIEKSNENNREFARQLEAIAGNRAAARGKL